ncbi:MAG: sulfite exporter TauE/SafE family protein [Oscillospiraceae bacterium]
MTNTSLQLPLQGMICRACEDAVCERLLHTRGVIDASASYRKGRVTVEYDPELVTRETLERVLAETGYPVGERSLSGTVIDALCLALAVLLAWAIPKMTALVHVPAVTENASLGYVFLIGLLTGTHCIGMCGGILLSQTTNPGEITTRTRRGAVASAAYNGGRVVSYTAAGAMFGAAGSILSYTVNVRSMVFTITGALMLLIGLSMSGAAPGLRVFGELLPGACALPSQAKRRFAGRPFVIGLLTGLMPCGALSAMWMYAVSTGSALRGALAMGVFALGTVPLLFLFGALQSFLPCGWMKYLIKASSVLVTALGLSMLVKGLRLLIAL